MTTLAWIYIGVGLAMATIALTSFFGTRQMRERLTRRSLPLFISQCVVWVLFGVYFFRGLLAVVYFATLAVIFIPTIVWCLRSPTERGPEKKGT